VDVHLAAPDFDMLTAIYPESDIGWKQFQHDCNLHLKLEEGKMKLMSSLKECMDREVKSKVEAHHEFSNAMSTYNLLSLWRISEEVSVGRGAVSIY
jgi:hypothetical protein